MRSALWSPLLILLLVTAAAAVNPFENAGTTAYTFLKLPVSPKATAMGGAQTALPVDASSIVANPALGAALDARSISLIYNKYLLDINGGYLGMVEPVKDVGTFGIGVTYFSYGNFKRYDEQGRGTGDFTAGDFALTLGYARTLFRGFWLGANARYISETIDDASSSGMALDLGAAFRSRQGRTTLGLAVLNLGFQRKGMTNNYKDDMPLSIRAGVTHRMEELPLLISADVVTPLDEAFKINVGVEWVKWAPFYARLGWSSASFQYQVGAKTDVLAGLSAGIGYTWSGLGVDYAISSMGELGIVHRIGLSYRFSIN